MSSGLSGPDGAAYYEANYPDYVRQNPDRKLDFYLGLVRRWAPPPARLHELGVGLGAFLERAAHEYECSGGDVNRYGVEATRRRVPRAQVTEGSFEEIPAEPPCQVIVAFDVLEHLPNLDRALATIAARLAPGGVLIGVVPVYGGALGWLVRLLDRDPTHVSKWPRDRWLETLHRHGFRVAESGGIIRKLIAGHWYLHLTRPAWLWRRAGSAIWFVALAREGA